MRLTKNCFVLMLFSLTHVIESEQQLSNLAQKIETQKEKLRDHTITGNLKTDSQLVIKETYDFGSDFKFQESRYFIDDREISAPPVTYSRLIKNGNHVLKIEKEYRYNYKIFTYMNVKKYYLARQFEFTLEAGHTTYLDVILHKTNQEKSPLDLVLKKDTL